MEDSSSDDDRAERKRRKKEKKALKAAAKERKKEARKRAKAGSDSDGGSSDDDAGEDKRLRKKLKKLLKKQRQEQQQQLLPPQALPPQAPPSASPSATVSPSSFSLPDIPAPAPKRKPFAAAQPAIPTAVPTTAAELARRAERARRFMEPAAVAAAAGGDNGAAAAGKRRPRPHAVIEEELVSPSGGLVRMGAGFGGSKRGRQRQGFQATKGGEEDDYRSVKPLVGTCMVVEREYTRTVDPATVRPLAVLKEALQRVKRHWAHHEEYEHACGRLKSIRQDLRVQHVETAFTVHVYETHARIALEAGDLDEFCLCANRLDELRAAGLPTAADEFAAYRLLHALYCGNPVRIRAVMLGINHGPDEGDQEEEVSRLRDSEPVRHAMEVVRAHAQGNYHRFFRLYGAAPHMSGFLMDFLVLRMRRLAIDRCLAAYGPQGLPIPFLAEELAFDDAEECRRFLVEKEGCVLLATGAAGGQQQGGPPRLDVRESARRRRLLQERQQQQGR